MSPGLAADQAAQHKTDKYSKLLSTHIFCPVAIETAGSWNGLAIELVQEIGRRITAITEDARESVSVPAPVNGYSCYDDDIPQRERGHGLGAEFLNFKPPSVNLERVKLEISNLVH